MILLSLLLVVATAAVYLPVRSFDFCGFDDDVYVSENPVVRQGLTPRGAAWAFSTFRAANWHPLTWLSHMLDVSLFGLAPGAHHLVNAAFHAANAVLLFLLLRGMTGALWRSAAAAALFAAHPLHAESVAWIAQRKDVLCSFFFLLMLRAYLGYARFPSRGRFAAVTALFALGLLAKPMLVTAPFVLLLLDYWPLGRIGKSRPNPGALSAGQPPAAGWRRAVTEKIPLFLLSALSSVVTVVAQSRGGAMLPTHALPLWPRIANALVAYAAYLGKAVWPSGLAAYYPHPKGEIPSWKVAGAALLLLALTGVAVREARRRPFLVVGWFWFLGMLVPVIGLMQVGGQAMADRYTYLPLVGLSLAVVWGASQSVEGRRFRAAALSATTAAVLLALAVTARTQVAHWKDGVALFSHALRVTEKNALAHVNLGTQFARTGRLDEAFRHFIEAKRIDPASAIAWNNLGALYNGRGELEEALRHFHEAVRLWPDYPLAHRNLSEAYMKLGMLAEAAGHSREAVRLDPENPAALHELARILEEQGKPTEALSYYRDAALLDPNNPVFQVDLGISLSRKGDLDGAIRHYLAALRSDPEMRGAHYNLAVALDRTGRTGDAIAHYERAVAIRPDDPKARVNLGLAFARLGRFAEAIRQYEEALRVNPDDAKCLLNFGVALAELGRFEEAIVRFREVLRLAPADPSAHLNIGLALKALGRTRESARHFRKAMDAPEAGDDIRDRAVEQLRAPVSR